MKEIKRYKIEDNFLDLGVKGGLFVREEDYAALQEQVRALAAENKRAIDAVTVFSNVTHEITEIICDEIGQDKVAEILAAYNDIGNTPATDAALREIRADGAMECGVHLREWYGYQVEERAEEFAAALRTGEQP